MKYLMKGVIFLIVYKYSSSAGSCIYMAISVYCTTIDKLISIMLSKSIVMNFFIFVNSDHSMVFRTNPYIPLMVFHDIIDSMSN